MHFDIILIGLLPTLFLCGATGALAARGVLSIAPAEAMRPVVLPPGKKNLLEQWLPGLWARTTFGWKLVLRGIWRNGQRFALSAAGVALTFAIILFAVYMFTIWDVVIYDQFGRMETYDYSISFISPVSSKVLTELRSLAKITSIEPYVELPFLVSRGWREQTVLARALPRTTELYQFEDQRGYAISLPAKGILLSQGFAQSLGVGPGDMLEMSSYATADRSYQVCVQGVINQYLGSGLYMSLEQLARLTGQKDTLSGVVLKSSANVKDVFRDMGNIESIQSSADLVSTFSEYLNMIIASAGFIVFLGGVLGFAILYNTTSVSIAERKRELSSLRVLGYSQQEIFALIMRENGLALALGLIVGAPLGKSMIVAVINAVIGSAGDLLYFPTDIKLSGYVLAAALVIAFMALTMLTVRRKILKLNFLEALSSRLT